MPRATPEHMQTLSPEQRAQIRYLQQFRAHQDSQREAEAQGHARDRRPVDPVTQAALDASFRPVPLTFSDEERSQLVCERHLQESCKPCGIDFKAVNDLARLLLERELVVPPPPKVTDNLRNDDATKAKRDGNALFHEHQYAAAVQSYTLAIELAISAPSWEAAAYLSDNLAGCFCNRSHAYAHLEDYTNSLRDAEAAIEIRRDWPKGHYRKAKALVGGGKLLEAKEAGELALQLDPKSAEIQHLMKEIETAIAQK